MTASRVCGLARLALVSGLFVLASVGLCGCSGGTTASPAHTTTASTGTKPPTSTSSQPAPSSEAPSTPHTTQSPTSAQPTTTASSAPPSATVVNTFSPFDPATGKVDIRIDTTRSGYCWTGSIAVGAPSAYRCMAHNLILDPCFARTGHPGSVICVNAPWDGGTRLHLDRPLPSSHNTGRAREGWALQLANGQRCLTITGTVGFVHDVPMRFGCGTGGDRAGDLQHHGTRWTVDYVAPHTAALSRVEVTTVWR